MQRMIIIITLLFISFTEVVPTEKEEQLLHVLDRLGKNLLHIMYFKMIMMKIIITRCNSNGLVFLARFLIYLLSNELKISRFSNNIYFKVTERNRDLRQLWYAMPGEDNGQIIAFVQIRISALKSCGENCKFTVFYEPVDKSEVRQQRMQQILHTMT